MTQSNSFIDWVSAQRKFITDPSNNLLCGVISARTNSYGLFNNNSDAAKYTFIKQYEIATKYPFTIKNISNVNKYNQRMYNTLKTLFVTAPKPTIPLALYRGIYIPKDVIIHDKELMINADFTSFSLDESVAILYTSAKYNQNKYNRVIIQLTINPDDLNALYCGKKYDDEPYRHLSDYMQRCIDPNIFSRNEKEVIVSPFVAKITKITRQDDGIILVRIEYNKTYNIDRTYNDLDGTISFHIIRRRTAGGGRREPVRRGSSESRTVLQLKELAVISNIQADIIAKLRAKRRYIMQKH